MCNWRQLEQDVCVWLSGYASPNLEFRNSNQAIIGFPPDGFRSDGMLTDGNTLLAVEIEAGQIHPDTNVGKYWLLKERYQRYQRSVLFHVYTADFNSYGWRKELGEFYARKMSIEFDFDYILLDYRTATDYNTVLEDVMNQISARIEQEFGVR